MTAGLGLQARRRARRPGLTPLIDVVFLLVVFFMLASRFGPDASIALSAGEAAPADWTGPPRLVEVAAGELRLNGVAVAGAALAGALRPLMAEPSNPVLVRPLASASTQELVGVLALLEEAGFETVVLVGVSDAP
ncbi:MAG: ExbD/TolR family protein [Rubricella sp.]